MSAVLERVEATALEYALRYAALGWAVLPVEPSGKRPLHGQGIDHASTDSEQIRLWFEAHPDANIGIRLDAAGLLAVDIDPRNGGPLDIVEHLPATLTAATGGGGLHLLYRFEAVRQVPGKLGQGIDLKYHGYIVVAPSRHPSGGAYAWRGWDVLSGERPSIALAPADLFESRAAAEDAIESDTQVSEGGRNDFLSREAYRLRKRGLHVDDIEAVLLSRNQQRCIPPLSDLEVHLIAAGKERMGMPGVRLEDFWAHMPSHQYLFIPTRELWPASSVNGRCVWPTAEGKQIPPASWLDRNRPVEQFIWHPGEPDLIENRVMQDSGWVRHDGARAFNLYRPPVVVPGDASKAGPWLDHVHKVYPDDAPHIIRWLAQRVQQPGVKCNHALVLGGDQGIGKDTLLEPLKAAVGPWNWSEITPAQMLGRFNGWAKGVVVRVNEARDLGEVDRFAFYDHSKVYIAAPPDVIRVDEKHLRETSVANMLGLIITTNHASDGLYLPSDDRRHYVAWSPRTREDFEADYWTRLYSWMRDGGTAHVAAYLRELDLSDFDPKAPPPKTAAFWTIVAAGEAPESGELRDVLDVMGCPEAVTLGQIVDTATNLQLFGLAEELRDRKGLRSIPHKFERVGYVPVRNPDAEDGKFRIGARRVSVYARRTLPVRDQIRAARELT